MNTNQQRTIAIVTPYFPPYGGGLERYAYEIAKRLQEDRSWRVVVITSSERYGEDIKEEMDGLTVYRLSYSLKFSNTPFSFKWFGKIRNILKIENPDIINIHAPVPGIGDITALLAGNKKIIVTYHAGSMRKGKFLPDIFIWLYENGILPLLLWRADFLVCSSDFLRFNFLRRYLSKSITITPAVDPELFKPDLTKKAQKPTILFVAGLGWAERHKGLRVLLRAMEKLHETISDIHLFVVGDGDMRNEYEKISRTLGLNKNVTFTGRLEGRELAEKYQQAHIFVLPSKNESFSMVILEAMSSGLPVVASNACGIPLVVDNEKNGLLVPSGNAEELASAIERILGDHSLAERFSQASLVKARQFKWEGSSEGYHKLFLGILRPA
jgi:glycosyltransferase involved in cell wall biosynthesis